MSLVLLASTFQKMNNRRRHCPFTKRRRLNLLFWLVSPCVSLARAEPIFRARKQFSKTGNHGINYRLRQRI